MYKKVKNRLFQEGQQPIIRMIQYLGIVLSLIMPQFSVVAKTIPEEDFYPRLNSNNYYVLSCLDTQEYRSIQQTEVNPTKYLCHLKNGGIQIVCAKMKINLPNNDGQVSYNNLLSVYSVSQNDSVWMYDNSGMLKAKAAEDNILHRWHAEAYLIRTNNNWKAVTKNKQFEVVLDVDEIPFRVEGIVLHTAIEADTFVRFLSEEYRVRIPRTKSWRSVEQSFVMYDSTTRFASIYKASNNKIVTSFDVITESTEHCTIGTKFGNTIVKLPNDQEYVIGPYQVSLYSDSLLIVYDSTSHQSWVSSLTGDTLVSNNYTHCNFNQTGLDDYVISCYVRNYKKPYAAQLISKDGKVVALYNMAGKKEEIVSFSIIEDVISTEYVALVSKYQKEKVLYRIAGSEGHQIPSCK